MPTEMNGELRWQSGLEIIGLTDSGHQIVMDGDADTGGQEAGPSPMELLLLSLAGCTAMDVISILQKMRQPVEGYQVKVNATRQDEHPRVFTHVTIEHIFTGDIAEDRLARAIELSDTKYCSAQAMLRKAVEIETRFRIEKSGEPS